MLALRAGPAPCVLNYGRMRWSWRRQPISDSAADFAVDRTEKSSAGVSYWEWRQVTCRNVQCVTAPTKGYCWNGLMRASPETMAKSSILRVASSWPPDRQMPAI